MRCLQSQKCQKTTSWAPGQIKICPMGNYGVRCTSTRWDKYNELDLEWFWAVVFAVRCLQSPKRQKTAISCPWASQNLPNGQLRYPLHIYVLRRIQRTWFGVIRTGSFCCALFTKSKPPRKSHFLPVGKSKFARRWQNGNQHNSPGLEVHPVKYCGWTPNGFQMRAIWN